MAVDPATAGDAGVLSGIDVAGRVVRGGAMRVIAYVVVNLLGIGSAVVLLRHLGVDNYGRYGTVIALVGIASGLAEVGLTMTGSRELALAAPGEVRRRLLGALLGVRLLLITVAALGALLFAVVARYDSSMVAGTALAGAGAVLVGAQSTLTLPLVVGLRNGLLSVNEVLKQVILFAGILILAAAGAALTPFFAVQLLVGVGAMLAAPLLVDRAQLAWPSLSRADVRHLALVGLPIAFAAILTTFYIRMLVVLASLETSNHETGLFVTSARVVEMIGGLALLVMGVILPVATVAARDDRPRLRYVLAHTTKLAMLAGGLLAVVVVVGARPIVVLLGGEEFADAAAVLRLQGPVVLSTFLVYVWTAFLIADGHRRALVRCMAIGTLTLMVSGVTLIAQFDARGAAVAAVVADVVLVVVAGLAARRVGDGRIGIDAGYLARYAVALAGAAGAALALLAIAPASVAALAGAAGFGLAAFALRIVPSELTTLLRR
jgi:O-antigen/teichoic acid export membrane protein